jgi:VWFA-related protein
MRNAERRTLNSKLELRSSKFRVQSFFLALAAAAGLSGPPLTGANLLQLDVVAVDAAGRPVVDLRRDEIEIWISGLRVPIDTFSAVKADAPGDYRRTIVLIMDDVAAGPTLTPRVKEIAERIVDRMTPGDRVAVVMLSGKRSEATDDRVALKRAIDDYRGAMTPIRPDDASEHVLKSIVSISRQLLEIPGRKAIVAAGAPWMFDTPIPPPGAQRDLRPVWIEAMRSTAYANASLYVIDPGGLGMQGPVYGGGSGFARETGGHAFVNTNDYAEAVDRIFRETGNYYLIGITDPPVQKTADLRELDVKSLRPGVTIRARKGLPPGRI